jgi:hypothetical protein
MAKKKKIDEAIEDTLNEQVEEKPKKEVKKSGVDLSSIPPKYRKHNKGGRK